MLAGIRGSGAAAANSVTHNTDNSRTASMHVDTITIMTQGKDANAIARDITQAMKTHAYAVQSNYGPA